MGCGSGEFTNILKKYYGKVIGIDISDKMINLAREKSKGNIIIGVYHPLGRFFMNVKKQFIKLHKYFYFLDKRYRNNYSRKDEWIMDQYFNPYEK